MAQEKQLVTLTAKDAKDGNKQSFEVSQANKLLKMNRSQFQLADKNWSWNGIELAKAKDAKETNESKETTKA